MGKRIIKRIFSLFLALTLLIGLAPAQEAKAAKKWDNSYEKSYYYDQYLFGNWILHDFSNSTFGRMQYDSSLGLYKAYYGQTYKTSEALGSFKNPEVKFSDKYLESTVSSRLEVTSDSSFKCVGLGGASIKAYATGTLNGSAFEDKLMCGVSIQVVDVPIESLDVTTSVNEAYVGKTIKFTATVKGSATPTNVTYQWYKNGTAIRGATSKTYTTPALTLSDDGAKYHCVAKNSSGSKTSFKTIIRVRDVLPTITAKNPTSNTINRNVGITTTLSVTASGTNLKYQWYKNSTAIKGATGKSYTIPADSAPTSAQYQCVVWNTSSNIGTNWIVHTKDIAPVIATHPANVITTVGSKAAFTVKATGTNLKYQWYKASSSTGAGTAVSGATAASYTTPTLSYGTQYYYCVVSNATSTATTTRALLTVNNVAPSIKTNPTNTTAVVGNKATFTVAANGTNNKYQWYKMAAGAITGSSIYGANEASYTTPATKITDNGAYYYCVVSNANNTSVTSGKALLTVRDVAPTITVNPVAASTTVGNKATFTVTANGTNNKYQWYSASSASGAGTAISGATTASYIIPKTTISDNGKYYYCVISNTGNSAVTSSRALLTVKNVAPSITANPESTVNRTGSTATFKVVADGTNNVYQWYKATDNTSEGKAIEGATDASYTTPTLTIEDDGKYYYCVIFNTGNSTVTSKRALLSVLDVAPSIKKNPIDTSVKVGTTATFEIEADGTNNRYQWYCANSTTAAGTKIKGATSSSYSFDTSIDDNGVYYYCVVSNIGNSPVSSTRAKLSLYCTVTFNANGGECEYETINQTIGEAYNLPKATRNDYLQNGWFTQPDGGVKVTSSTIKEDAADITLYAQWVDALQFVSNNLLYTVVDENKKYVKVTYSFDSDKFGLGQQDNSAVNNVTIPNTVTHGGEVYTVTEVSDNCFDSCQYLYTVSIPDTVTKIGDYAFYNCQNLNSVDIPSSVSNIGEAVFKNCAKLDNVKIPDKVKLIQTDTFMECSALNNIKLSSSLVEIEDNAFKDCTSLTRVEFPDALKSLGNHSFGGCSSLAEIILPNGLQGIGDYTFHGNTNLKNFIIPETVNSIGEGAFKGCATITNVKIPENITTIKANMFNGCINLDTIVLPTKLQSIKESAFENCNKLNNITIPETVTELGNSAFKNCGKIANITIPAKLKTIGTDVFSGAGITICYTYGMDAEMLKKLFNGSTVTNMYLNDSKIYEDENALAGCTIINKKMFYIINFYENYGENTHTTTKNISGENIVLPSKSREGYNFKGWALNSDDTAALYDANSNQSFGQDTNLYGIWSANKYQVAFNANGGNATKEEGQVTYNEPYGELPTASRDGYKFMGWFTQTEDGTKITKDSIYSVAGNQTLYAQWKAKKYTVTFDGNGGEATKTEKEVTYNEAYGELPTANQDGYKFIGWFTSSEGGTKITQDTIVTIADNQTLYAQWEDNTYSVSFDGNGGISDSVARDIIYGQAYGELPIASRDGYKFLGWYTSKTGGTKVTEKTVYEIVGNQTLYAQWKANNYTITFDGNSGKSSTGSKAVTYNEAYGTLPTASRDGYKFLGWYTAKNGGTQVTEKTIYEIVGNQTVYARWKAIEYKVIFDGNGGKVSTKNKTVAYGKAYGTLPTASRDGYKFLGWYTAKNGGTQVTEETVYKIVGSQTIYARWEVMKYKVAFSGNGGKVSVTNTKVTYGHTYGKLPTASREGYKFLGWYTAKNGGTKIINTSKVSITKNQTLYARWKVIKATFIKLNKTKVNVTLGKSVMLKVAPKPTNAYKKLTWSSSNKKIATVSKNGKITGKSVGNAIITVKDKTSGLKKTCLVTVKRQKKSSVSIKAATTKSIAKATVIFGTSKAPITRATTMKKGKQMKIAISKYSLPAAKKKVFYKSSNKRILSVTNKGTVKAKKKGTAYITVKGRNGSVVKIKIKVKQ